VTLATGERIAARGVIDGRGPMPSSHLWLGFQKFVGQEVELAAPHGLVRPIVMDATVEQIGGYRFVYVLPFSPTRLLIEDTYYTDGDELDVAAIRARIAEYAVGQGWRIAQTLAEETGVLPIVLGGDVDAFWHEAGDVPRSGLRAALFHATTGYSLPDAVRLALKIASSPDLSSPALLRLIREHAAAQWRHAAFYRALNRMLFLAAETGRRRDVMRRFYTLPEPLITRFYAGTTTLADKACILVGRPSVPVGAAVQALFARRKEDR
jgi:lycopene beta-cyclase